MVNINFYNLIENMVEAEREINWSMVSKNAKIDFIEKHLDDPRYLFNWDDIASNIHITIDFVKKYYSYFIKEDVIAESSKYVIDDIDFIRNDKKHVEILGEEEYKQICITKLQFVTCENNGEICENYEKFRTPYNPRNNPYDCDSCGDYDHRDSCYDVMVKDLYDRRRFYKDHALFNFKDKLYIVPYEYAEVAVDLLLAGLKINKPDKGGSIRTFMDKNILTVLTQNPGISIEDQLETKDVIAWDWDAYQYNTRITKEQFEQIRPLMDECKREYLDEYFTEVNHELLDKVLNNEIEVSFFTAVLATKSYDKNTDDAVLQVLKSYDKIQKLIKKLVDDYPQNIRYDFFYTFSDIVSFDTVLENLDIDWNLPKLVDRDDITFDIIKKIHEYRSRTNKSFMSNLSYGQISAKDWVTEDLVLQNLDFPWSLRTFLTGTYENNGWA